MLKTARDIEFPTILQKMRRKVLAAAAAAISKQSKAEIIKIIATVIKV